MIKNNKPTVAILFTESAKGDMARPFKRRNISRAHSIFSKKCERHGLNAVFAQYREYKGGKLKRCWQRKNDRWKLVEDQPIDVVYSRFAGSIYSNNKKDRFAEGFKWKMAEQVSMINHPLLDEFCWDKKIVAEMFPEYSPKTFVVNTKKGLKLVLPEIRSNKVVIKPRYGTLGKNVIITDKDNLPEKIGKNTLVQEFIDSSKGIKGVRRGIHDLRLFMINGKLDHAHMRIPKKGSLTANVALGGKKIFIRNKLVPKSAVRVAKQVDKLFKDYHPRIFSVDFMFDEKGRAWIVECNSQPMIDKYAFGKFARITFYDRVIEALKSGIKIKVTTPTE